MVGKSGAGTRKRLSSAGVRVRLAELVGALSLGIDLGFGQPMEHVLRQCRIALRLAECVGLDEQARADVYYTALLVNVGCHTDAHEQAKWFGDDIALKSGKYDHEFGSVGDLLATLKLLGSNNRPLHRFRIGIEFALGGHREVDGMIASHAAMAEQLARDLHLTDGAVAGVANSYEQWDGKGWPGNLSGDAVPLAARIAQLAEFVEVAHRTAGVDAAVALVRKRAGKQFDPVLARVLAEHADAILADLDSAAWDAVIEAEPALAVTLSPGEFDAALLAIATFIDLKSPYTLGHSAAVAELAAAAATHLGLDAEEVQTVRRAALAHDFGRLGVSNAIWDKPAPLGAGEWERVRLAPYLTERMLRQSAALAPLGAIALQHRERLDGTGYPRGLSGAAIARPARIVGIADAYRAMREPRPHRDPLSPDAAARELRAAVRAGHLDAGVVEVVLIAAGHRVGRRREGPAGLTPRELEVLALVARGMSNREVAQRLVIAPKTAGNHVEHIYAKIGVSNRAAASLFAVRHGLLEDEAIAP